MREIDYTDSMNNVREIAKKINDIETITDAPMKNRTTFRTGGSADLLILPADTEELQTVLRLLSQLQSPFFLLGGGANLLIGDLIELQFLGNSYNLNLGSAMSLVLMVIVLLCMSFTSSFDEEEMEGVM